MKTQNTVSPAPGDSAEIKTDWVPKEHYTSPAFAELEREYLWPRIWQVACREEELPLVGSFVTYEILDESVIVIRTSETEIKAYNNACLHRGRRLTEGSGRTASFVCKFHGWSWNLRGENLRVVDEDDWRGCLKSADLHLHEFKVGRWGGFVFINMDSASESFEDYLGAVPEHLNCMEFDKQRYRWYISVEVEANWKICQEAFVEGYHVQTTHRGLEPHTDGKLQSRTHGRHGSLVKHPGEPVVGRYNTGRRYDDQRLSYLEVVRLQACDIGSVYSDRDYQAARRILDVLPPTATWVESARKASEFMRQAGHASGAGYPQFTGEQAMRAGVDWNIFPNTVCVLGPAAGLWYRFRPVPSNNPNRCIFDIYSLERFAPGAEPKLKKGIFKDWKDCESMPPFLLEDFANLPDIQRGVRTKYFAGALPNPLQESVISNMHRALREFIQSGVRSKQTGERH